MRHTLRLFQCVARRERHSLLTASRNGAQYFAVTLRMAPEFRGAPFLRDLATLVGAAAIAGAAVWGSDSPAKATELVPWTGDAAPSFILPAIDGGDVRLGAQHGNAILVHFFATWCEACAEELPALSRLAERGAPSFKVVAVAVADTDGRVRRLAQTVSASFPMLLDRDRAVAKAWKVTSLPTTVILDRRLTPRLIVESDYAWDTLDPTQLIDRLSQDARNDNTASMPQGGQ